MNRYFLMGGLSLALLVFGGTAEAGKCGKGGFFKGRKARKAVCYVAPSYNAYPLYQAYPSYAPVPQYQPAPTPQTPSKVTPEPQPPVVLPIPSTAVVEPLPENNGPPIFTDPTPPAPPQN